MELIYLLYIFPTKKNEVLIPVLKTSGTSTLINMRLKYLITISSFLWLFNRLTGQTQPVYVVGDAEEYFFSELDTAGTNMETVQYCAYWESNC